MVRPARRRSQKHSLADLKDKDVVVVVFTCCTCPAAEDYEDRIIAFAKKYAAADAKVALVPPPATRTGCRRRKGGRPRRSFRSPTFTTRARKSAGPRPSTPLEKKMLNKDRKAVYLDSMDDRDIRPRSRRSMFEEAGAGGPQGGAVGCRRDGGVGCRIPYVRKKKK